MTSKMPTGINMESDAIDRRSEFAAEVKARTGIDEAMIQRLVHGFYSRIRIDPVLGPIFAARIKEWDPHLARMCAFCKDGVVAADLVGCLAI